MLNKIIVSLREELAPLVRAELRESLEKSVRQELRQEMLAAGLHDSTKASNDTSLEARLAALLDQSSKQVSGVVSECSAKQLASLSLGLEQIAKQITNDLITGSKHEIEPSSTSSELPSLMSNLASEISAKMEQSMDLRLAELRGTLREELEPRIKGELEPQVRAAMHEEVESEKRRLVEEATHQTLLEYLLKKKWKGIGAFLESIPLRMRLEAKEALREILSPEVRWQMLKELREEVKNDENHPISKKIENVLRGDTTYRASLISRMLDNLHGQIANDPMHPILRSAIADLRADATVREVAIAKLKSELAPDIRKELRESLKTEVRETLENQMLVPVLLGADGNLEGTVAGVLRKNLSVCVNDMRDTILDEIWELATTAILESLGAALMPVDGDGELLMERAMEAATKVYKPKSADARLKLSSAVSAILNVIEPGSSEHAEERWWFFARMAQELIDDRLIPSTFKSSRKLDIPEGFFRAVKTHTCDASKNVIQPGDFYVVVRGLRIALPLTQESAEELVRRSAANEIPEDDDTVAPPWNGVPFSP
jgi:hypothetical protein